MIRDDAVVEIIRRLNTIQVVNGYEFNFIAASRNPEHEPSPDRMPHTNIFEFPEITLGAHSRGSSIPPSYKKEFQVVLEHWYKSATRGETTKDILTFLTASRKVLFTGGTTLGGICQEVIESEVSRVYRPQVGNHVVGVGQVLTITYIEDFNNL
jgi:hypothetical protein